MISNASILQGDCLTELLHVPDESVDLIVTSPPYAEARKATYGGIRPGDYVAWFLPRARQMWRAMKPAGSFVLNIKEGTDRYEGIELNAGYARRAEANLMTVSPLFNGASDGKKTARRVSPRSLKPSVENIGTRTAATIGVWPVRRADGAGRLKRGKLSRRTIRAKKSGAENVKVTAIWSMATRR